jgi:hypothetical protein
MKKKTPKAKSARRTTRVLDPEYYWRRDKTLSLKQRVSEARHDLHDALIANNNKIPEAVVTAWAMLDLLLGPLLPRACRHITVH